MGWHALVPGRYASAMALPVVPNTLFQIGRIVIGTAFVVAPAKAGDGWVGEAAVADGGVMARAFGGRDIALGIATIAAASDRRLFTTLLATGVMVDAIDCAATVAAGDRIPQQARTVSGALAAGAALNGIGLLLRASRSNAA